MRTAETAFPLAQAVKRVGACIKLKWGLCISVRDLVRRIAIRAALLAKALRWCVAALLLAAPSQGFNAISDSLSPINGLPRFALVIGNSRYAGAPLDNPGNDANAIADQLRRMGFTVTLKLDATRKEMLDTIQTFGGNLAKQKGVGLFYFAGHGAQLSWRNYLIPVDAAIEQMSDMQTQAVDLGLLLESLTRASNPMNVIILDACRDNPFGNKVRVEQKGLSQIDAPPGTLLAYATSPGNTAADGTGTNGLYTEHLLQEMRTREVKIEDIFKRVRLYVRRQSGGRQIPWESTSLEEDFFLIPPAQIRKLTGDEAEKQFEQELLLWEKVKVSKEVPPLEDYLRRYPSGRFSELAQFRLDRLLAQLESPVQTASAPATTAQVPAQSISAAAEAVRKRQEELARAEAELKKQQDLAKAEAERKRQEEIARAEAERKRLDALAKAESERRRLEEMARAETERRKKEDLARAEAERKRQEDLARAEAQVRKQQELAKAEADRKQHEELARAEVELKKQQELAKAEASRKQQEGLARAEMERKRHDALAKADAERKQLEQLALAEGERKKKEDLLGEETERKRQNELARAEAEVKKQQEFAKAEVARTEKEDLARADAGKAAPSQLVQVASIAPNPFSRGTGKANPNYRVGDSYSYRTIDTLTQLQTREYTNRVAGVTDSEVIYGNGGFITDLLGNTTKNVNAIGVDVSDKQFYIGEYSVGKKWTTRWRYSTASGEKRTGEVDFKVVAWEKITVPAGTFDAYKVEGKGFSSVGSYLQETYWIAPDKVRRPIIYMQVYRDRSGRFFSTSRNELVAYRQSD